ncbi:MAG TPA: hypothetical protein VGF45_19405 [Polyangia bacterium]
MSKFLRTSAPIACCLSFLAACADTQPDSRSAAPAQSTGVVANRFDVRQTLSGDALELWLETDLPDETEVMVSVARGYRQAGDTTAYSHAYFEESGSVREWRAPRQVLLDEHAWRNGLTEHQRLLARAGSPFMVSHVDDSVAVSFVIPVNQEDPRFGSRNEHLTGGAVAVGSLGWPIIERELRLARPVEDPRPSAANWASWLDLNIGGRYRISRTVPLMPELEPADPMQAIAHIKQIPPGGVILIRERRDRRGTLWYQAKAHTPTGAPIGEGWINSTALLGQNIQVAR